MNKKILAFVCDGEKFLLLRNNSEDPSHGGDCWFTVTGSVESGESVLDAVKREVKEETNLDAAEIFDLKWGSIYSWGGEVHSENNFLVFVKKGKIILNEEHVDFEWLNLDDFIEKINWGLNKEELKNVLQKAIKKESFFKKEKIDDFRKKVA
ncbi:MAG: NUDIX domain-containing protein [Candidatus Pacearchaeota archaeon]